MEVEDLWIGRFDTTGLTEYSFNAFQSIQSLVIGNGVFWGVTSFELGSLPSLQTIDIGMRCFLWALSFSLTGLIDWMDWIHRSSSTTICQTGWKGIPCCSISCVWEWLNGWIDDSDLPKLQSIQLNVFALQGDERLSTISDAPYNYKNTLTMRSEIEWNDEWIDLPSLTSFRGDGDNFASIGSVILESSHSVIDRTRYPSVIILGNPIRWVWLLLLRLFHPILKYSFSHFITIRCYWSRIIHQKQE